MGSNDDQEGGAQSGIERRVRRILEARRYRMSDPAFLAKPDYYRAHIWSSYHREQLAASEWCGCFDCVAIFRPEAITTWIDEQGTAMCPYCGIDSVIGSASGFPITRAFLHQMREYWCSGYSGEPRSDGFGPKPDHVRAQTWRRYHRPELEASELCGCTHCLSLFPPAEIREWVYLVQGVGTTAVCPRCGAKAVLGSACGFPMTVEFLAKVRDAGPRARGKGSA